MIFFNCSQHHILYFEWESKAQEPQKIKIITNRTFDNSILRFLCYACQHCNDHWTSRASFFSIFILLALESHKILWCIRAHNSCLLSSAKQLIMKRKIVFCGLCGWWVGICLVLHFTKRSENVNRCEGKTLRFLSDEKKRIVWKRSELTQTN
jgi:hypothetical protein